MKKILKTKKKIIKSKKVEDILKFTYKEKDNLS